MINAAGDPIATPAAKAQFAIAYIYGIAGVAALGGLLFGYDWVVIGGAKPFYEEFLGLTDPYQQGWAMSCALVGCLVGALVCGWLSDRFGRKRLLMTAGLVFAVSSIGTATVSSFAAFVPWRIMGGDWPSGWHRVCRRCTSRRWRPRISEASWFPSTS